MDRIEFSRDIPAEKLIAVFKNFFEEHMAMYDMLKGEHVKITSVDTNSASIIYSVRMLDDDNKEELMSRIKFMSQYFNIYGKTYDPDIYLNGDLLCITLNK